MTNHLKAAIGCLESLEYVDRDTDVPAQIECVTSVATAHALISIAESLAIIANTRKAQAA